MTVEEMEDSSLDDLKALEAIRERQKNALDWSWSKYNLYH
jgi:hypothetical protein